MVYFRPVFDAFMVILSEGGRIYVGVGCVVVKVLTKKQEDTNSRV